MAIDPNLGYDPFQYSPAGFPPQSIEQWAVDKATSWTIAYANGQGDAFPAELFADTYWQGLGLELPPDSAWGVTASNPNNSVDPALYQTMLQFAMKMATNPAEAQARGLVIPPGLQSRGPMTDDLGRSQIYDSTQAGLNRQNQLDVVNAQNTGNMARDAANNAAAAAEGAANRALTASEGAANRAHDLAVANLQEAGMSARQANELASRMSIAQLQDAGESSRNAARIAADIQMANQNDATQRYGIDRNVEVAGADRTSRENIAGADRTSRETIARDDRLENARQFDLGLGEDRRQFNSTMLFELFDRGIKLAQNPVDWLGFQYYNENLGIPVTALTMSSMAAMLGAVPPSGPSPAGPVVGGPGALDGDAELATAAGVQPRLVSLTEALQANPGGSDPMMQRYSYAETSKSWDAMGGMAEIEKLLVQQREAQVMSDPELSQSPVVRQAQQVAQQAMMAQGPATGATGMPELPPLGNRESLGAGAVMRAAATSNPMTTDAGGGIFTGASATSAPQATAPGGQGAPMEELLRNLAGQLGVPEADVFKMIDPKLLAPGYSRDVVANSPVIQALAQGKDRMSQFRTADATGQKFGNIQAFDIPTGLRSGQDMNANLIINNSGVNKDMIQGVVQGMGQNWEDWQRQSLKASPITSYAVGAQGRRR